MTNVETRMTNGDTSSLAFRHSFALRSSCIRHSLHEPAHPSSPQSPVSRHARSCAGDGLNPGHLIYPLFLQEGGENTPISSMPGCTRWSLDGLVKEAGEAHALGVPAVVLFPRIPDELKTRDAAACFADDGLVPRAIRALKAAHPTLTVITDVALDPYNSDGHDGLVADDGRILNDETVAVLQQQALCHARAGADMVSPSDMMDGRVAALREALDAAGFQAVSIMSYTAKYASAYYGPFRGAWTQRRRPETRKRIRWTRRMRVRRCVRPRWMRRKVPTSSW
jgi:delta-aminolevulinic acid dehydratase/porphobilinogen synthase